MPSGTNIPSVAVGYAMQTNEKSHSTSLGSADPAGDKQLQEINPIMHDVQPGLYPAVIRDMNRHENDVTNHRLMWLLLFQGLMANAYVSAGREGVVTMLAILPALGILGALSAFVILYKSYQARGYLQFLGNEAKRGTLREEHLPLTGWPKKRIKGWRKNVWACPWIGQAGDLMEPYLFLPSVLIAAWILVLLRRWTVLDIGVILILSVVLVVVILSVFCTAWVWSQRKDEEERP